MVEDQHWFTSASLSELVNCSVISIIEAIKKVTIIAAVICVLLDIFSSPLHFIVHPEKAHSITNVFLCLYLICGKYPLTTPHACNQQTNCLAI